jgi:hypothetical protein
MYGCGVSAQGRRAVPALRVTVARWRVAGGGNYPENNGSFHIVSMS